MASEKRTLSEISHLFLSEVRQKQTGSASPRPVRIAPPKTVEPQTDMTPQEVAEALEIETEPSAPSVQSSAVPLHPAIASDAPASIILASHLPDPASRVRAYARQLAESSGRVALVEIDATEIGITCFERGHSQHADPIILGDLDARQISETIAELGFDVDRWLISLPNPRTPEARDLLKAAPHWVLLSKADDDGVVATYRALKGLAELGKPRLSLAVVDAKDSAEAATVFHKLDDVSRRFLGCPMEEQPAVAAVTQISEQLVIHCRLSGQKPASMPQWKIVAALLQNASAPRKDTGPIAMEQPMKITEKAPEAEAKQSFEEIKPTTAAEPLAPKMTLRPAPQMEETQPTEVIDLSDGGDEAILQAVVRQGGADGMWVQCPVKAPMCPQAVLAVGRDQRLVLLAMAGKGLAEVRSIGLALRWMNENRELIRMALPQLAIDAAALPMVRLLVDHADLSAELIQPLLESATVTVQAYRKLKWGRKSGLLLEAA
jgi:hypothetical protein